MVAYHLKKIEEPHEKLHQAAHDVQQCAKECETCKRDECLKTIFDRLKGIYMPQILGLLDEAKGIFSETVYREMVLITNYDHLGLVVDEVLSVENLQKVEDKNALHAFDSSSFLSAVRKSERMSGAVLEIDIEKLLDIYGLPQTITPF